MGRRRGPEAEDAGGGRFWDEVLGRVFEEEGDGTNAARP